MERFYPLHVRVCTRCWLVQLPEFVAPEEIFTEYAYFSGYSTSWVEHARRYVEMITRAAGARRRTTSSSSSPRTTATCSSTSSAPASRSSGSTRRRTSQRRPRSAGCRRSSSSSAAQWPSGSRPRGERASLIVGNNVLAQVPDLNDFVGGVAIAARAATERRRSSSRTCSVCSSELQYDTIYHEHFSYFSFATIVEILRAHGLEAYDVEELPTHGGSLRVYAQHARRPACGVGGRRRADRTRGATRASLP